MNINKTDIFLALVSVIIIISSVLVPGFIYSAVVQDFSESQITKGEKVTIGKGNTGWVSRYQKGDDLAGQESEVLSFEGTDFRDSGSISFLIKRHRISEKGKRRTSSAYNTIVWIQDENGKNLQAFYVIWEDKQWGKPQTVIEGHGALDIFESITLDRVVGIGEWIFVTATWDAFTGRVDLFVNGESLVHRSNSNPNDPGKIEWNKALALAYKSAKTLRTGSDPRGSDPSYEALIAEVRIDDSALDVPGAYTLFRDTFRKYGLLPEIQSVTHDAFAKAGYSGKLVAGDTMTVTLKAEPGGTASVDIIQPGSMIDGIKAPDKIKIPGIALTESLDNPGTYTGGYNVGWGDFVVDGQVVGRFTNAYSVKADPVSAARLVTVDAVVHFEVNPSNDLVPADEDSRAGITVVATDANGKAVKSHPLMLTMSTTDEYTGILGGVNFEDAVGGELEVDWGGVTDSFGEVSAQYVSGFAAKTILVSAKDMTTGDVGVGWVRSYIDGTVDIVVKKPAVRSLAVTGSMKVSVSRDWLTADGRSRSRITAVVKDVDGKPMKGNQISFNLLSSNGSIRQIQSRTDSRGRAFADYIAGTVIGQVQIEVRDMTSGLVAVVSIELRPDAPAEISLKADPGEVFIGDTKGSQVTAKVTDINGNPNTNTDVLFEVIAGEGTVSAPKVATDDRDGIAAVTFLPGNNPGVVTVKATVMSREPTIEELEAARGAVFLYGLDEDPGRLDVLEWLAGPGDEVVEGQDLVILEDRRGDTYTVKAPRDGTLSVFTAEERDRVEYGQTLGYVLPLPE